MIVFFQPLKWKLYKTNKKKIKLKRGVVNLGTRQPVWQQSFFFRFSQAGETHESIGGYGGKKLGAPFYYIPLRVSRASSGNGKKCNAARTPRKQSSFTAPCHFVVPVAGGRDEKWPCGLKDG